MPFSNVEISLRIFLALMVTNCSAERSFSQLKHIKNPNRTTMRQEMLDSLSLQRIEADLLRKIIFYDIIKDIARHRSTIKTLECICMFSLIYER